MPASRAIAPVTLLALIGTAAHAEDVIGSFVDLRLGGGITGGSYHLDISEGTTYQAKTNETWDENYRLTAGFVGSLGLQNTGGWIWGFGLASTAHSGSTIHYVDAVSPDPLKVSGYSSVAVDADTSMRMWAVDGYIGYAVPVGQHVQLELLPFIGRGWAYLSVPESTSDARSPGDYFETGFTVNGVITLENGFQFGATAGYLYYETPVDPKDIEAAQGRNGVPATTLKQAEVARSAHFKYTANTYTAGLFIGVRL